MTNLLIIDATAEELMLILEKEDGNVFTYVGKAWARRHTKEILVALDSLLAEANTQKSDITHIGCVVGPGSFTGIRIGQATANALSFALGAKRIEITTLEPVLFGKRDGMALLDCNNDNFYALVRQDGQDKYFAISAADIEDFGLDPIYKTALFPEETRLVCNQKIANNQFVAQFTPFYLRLSQAEREQLKKDGNE